MDAGVSTILKVKKRLDSDTLDEDKILKYLRALDEIVIGFEILKSTGIGKSVNNLKKKGGSVALLCKALVKKWRSLVPVENSSPVKKSSPLNTLKSDFKSENVLTPPTKPSQKSPNKELNIREKEKMAIGSKSSNFQENKTIKKEQKVNTTTMQLCDLGFVSQAPTASPKKSKKIKTRHSTLAPRVPSLPSAEEIGISLLPDIQPNYTPQRHPDYLDDSSPRKRKAAASADIIPADLLSSRKSKTQVFSGRRAANRSGVVASLHEMCLKVLIENVEALFDTGGVPYDILEPVLAKCSPAQLWNLEEYNPYFTEDTGPLWKIHFLRDFKCLASTATSHDADWRTLYLEKHEERENKLKSIDAKIKASQASKQQVRQVKLAYVHTQAKAPPQVRRKQVRHGTGHGVVVPPPPSIRPPSSSTSSMTSSSNARVTSPRKPKQTAMMKKVKQMGNFHRSRANSSIIRR